MCRRLRSNGGGGCCIGEWCKKQLQNGAWGGCREHGRHVRRGWKGKERDRSAIVARRKRIRLEDGNQNVGRIKFLENCCALGAAGVRSDKLTRLTTGKMRNVREKVVKCSTEGSNRGLLDIRRVSLLTLPADVVALGCSVGKACDRVTPFLQGNTCVVGLQWGDEGKGKIVDFLTEHADVVVRYCGGANAGHTVRIGNEKYATNLLPVGVFRPGVMSVIGNGVVVDPARLLEEIGELNKRGILVTPENLRISYKAHVVMPYHKHEDAARENASGDKGIGTTRRGIGPAYADKAQRTTAIRMADLLHEEKLKERVHFIVGEKNKVLKCLYDAPPIEWKEVFENYRDYGRRLKPFIDDVGHLLIQNFREGKRIVFEGAHAVLLDVDHGTYPYVTSSSCSALGLYTVAAFRRKRCRTFLGS